MTLKFPLWILTAFVYLVAPSLGELPTNSLPPEEIAEYLDEKHARFSLPRILSLAKKLDLKLDGYKLNPKFGALILNGKTETVQKRKFPEIDSRGFDEDIFDEGFGDWSPMKRW